MSGITIGVFLLTAYFLGSIPTGYWVAKTVKGIDIRQYGSGGTGATNVLRNVGKVPALAVLLIDILKGSTAVLLIKYIYPGIATSTPSPNALAWIATAASLLVLVGHSRSVWIGFKGGKSAASGLGVLLALAWPVALGALLTFGGILAISRIVSLGSVGAAIAAFVLMVLTQQPLPYVLLGLAGGLYVMWRHQSNLRRILAGTEPRLGGNRSHSPQT
ncbi:MAG: glycerol-3-phosphate 1-O-acyltransferase PlsY [Leptolyngbyaceae cyanobacterium SM1_1_3]|nr:glycerol-3-phosphate 1-O-acyltransferase PlsY [Leptolyngbyaceae cyanobacterium SM1_1_3]NJN01047.1 glycerol-3-phosphate 1-O-acyltransferase PlsY [Leptolyngbyaceae cyanobacterium RM1_1_2]